jgi:hypothetical protein
MAGDLPIQKQSKMEKQEEKLNSLEYFYDKVLDAAEYYNSEYNDILKAFEEAKLMYEKEINNAFAEGYTNHANLVNTLNQ